MNKNVMTALSAAAALSGGTSNTQPSLAALMRRASNRKTNWLKLSLRGQDRSQR